ncbi:MAG: DUF1800 domain-containing protein [Acidobacteriota bacterium]
MRAPLLVFALLSSGLVVSAKPSIPNDDRAIIHTLNRLGYGARPGDVALVRASGLPAWIEQQLHPERIANDALDQRLAPLTTLTLDALTITRDYDAPVIAERKQRQRDGTDRVDTGEPGLTAAARQPSEAQRKNRLVLSELAEGKVLRAVYSERQLEEVLVDFWFNHFNVFAGKGPTRNYVTAYERDAIRPHVLGQFRDLLEASATSPAMLFYLDNWQNTSPAAGTKTAPAAPRQLRRGRGGLPPRVSPPRPKAAAGKAAARGLNENYARELMELHTLGVEGGYTQKDVVDVARAFTGWTMRPREGTGFMFVAARHDRGEKHVLGHVIKAGGDRSDGEQVLDILAAHPSTARFIAFKLAQRFISDTPPPAVVSRAAAVFRATHGDLREVVRAIVTAPEFFAPPAYRATVKTPLEFVASALRATGTDVRRAQPLVKTLRDLGMPLYFCQPPTGYDQTADAWVSSGLLVGRMNFALALAGGRLGGVTTPQGEDPDLDAVRARLVAGLLGGDVSPATSATLAKATSAEQLTALALAAPEFQRQ